jgi:hypothetical protein
MTTATIIDGLVAAFRAYIAEQGLPLIDAEELLYEDITPAQRKWLTAFIGLWEESDLGA